MEKVESWVYQIENYFVLANVSNENLKARYATLLLTKSAAIWLRTRGYDLQDSYMAIVKDRYDGYL